MQHRRHSRASRRTHHVIQTRRGCNCAGRSDQSGQRSPPTEKVMTMIHAHKARMLSGAIELKDGDDLDPNAVVQNALADLQKTVDDRLKAVEGKGIDPKLQAQIDAIQAKLNRPGTGTETDEAKAAAAVEKKAFETFVRRGREGLSADEMKSLRVSDDTAGGY